MLTIITINFIPRFITAKQSKRKLVSFNNLLAPFKAVMLLLVFMFTLFLPSNAQTRTYSIWHNSKCIGNLNVSRYFKNDSTIYLLQSQSEINLLYHFKIERYHRAVFFKDEMKEYKLLQMINENIRENKSAFWNGSAYVIKDGKTVIRLESKHIDYTIASMYYREPKEIKYVFSEVLQQFIAIKKPDAHRYLLEFPNGNTTTYIYKNGVCTEIVAETDWLEIQFKLVMSALLHNLITGELK